MSAILRPAGPEGVPETQLPSPAAMREDVRRSVLDVVDGRSSVEGVRREPEEADIDPDTFFAAPAMMSQSRIPGGSVTLLRTGPDKATLSVEADDQAATPNAAFRIVHADGKVTQQVLPIHETVATMEIDADADISAVFASLAA